MSSSSPGDEGDVELESEYQQQPDDLTTEDSDPSLTPVDISEATNILRELVRDEALQPDRAQILKYKYIDMSGKLFGSRDNEKSLVSEEKRLDTWLTRQHELTEAFESTASFQEEGEEREVGRLRTKLLRIGNDLEMSRERIMRLEFEEKNCREELEELQSEQDRISKLDNQDEIRQQLGTAIEGLEIELKLRRSEASAVQGEIELALSYLREREEEYQQILMREDEVKKNLVQAKTAPTTILVAIDSINRQKDEVIQTLIDKQQQLEVFLVNFASAKDEVRQRENVREALHQELEQLEGRYRDKQDEYSEMERGHGQELLDQGGYESDFILIDKQFKEVSDEIRRENEQLDKRQRTLDSLQKQLKRSDMSIGRVEQDIEVLQGVKGNHQMELEKRTAPISQMERKIAELQRSVRESHSMLEGQVFSQNTVDQDIHDLRIREGRLQSQITDLDKEMKETCLVEKNRLKERGSDAEKMYKLRITLEQILDQIKTKAGVISEEGKCFKDMQNKVQHFAEMHQSVKRDVSDIIQLIQDYKQKSAELDERYKILETELLDCKDACEDKNKTLQRSRLKYTSVIGVRDSFLIELSKTRMQLMETRSQIEEQRGEIKKMSGMINAAEEEMVRLRKKYELMLQERNDRGIQLIERNEETAIFYERLNVQDAVLRKGNIELESREEELQFIRVEITDLHRQIETLRKATPKVRQLETELAELQDEMTETHKCLRKLEKRAEDPREDPSRLVEVGSYPSGSFDELETKSLRLEEQLVAKEMQLRERELLLEHVARITEKAQSRVHQTSSYSRDQSARMNEVQTQLKECTKKLMALLSEMSMQRASSLQLQRDVEEKESELIGSYQRLEQGLPPSEQADATWQRMVRAERTRERQEGVLASEASSKIDLGSGVVTTAPRRPNAYIPEGDGELPIPKPYGSHAPFKPSEPGSNIRHIRKPLLKPIQL